MLSCYIHANTLVHVWADRFDTVSKLQSHLAETFKLNTADVTVFIVEGWHPDVRAYRVFTLFDAAVPYPRRADVARDADAEDVASEFIAANIALRKDHA